MVDDDELIEFASIPAPTGSEAARIDWLVQRLDGFPGERAVDATGNLVWRFGSERPRLLVMAHVDTWVRRGWVIFAAPGRRAPRSRPRR